MPPRLDQSGLLVLLLGLATLLLLVQTARLWARGHAGRRNAARARRLGRQGERDARRLLERAAFRVQAEQPSARLELRVDGELCTAHLRPDFLVTRGGRRYVADAKAGVDAVKITRRGTRRQLLEYALAFPEATGILLVDTESGRIHTVVFPRIGAPTPRWSLASLWTFLLGATSGALAAAAWLL